MKYKITKSEFHQMLDQGWTVIDVREPYEQTAYGMYNPSTNIPYPGVMLNANKLFPDKNTKLIIVCNYGNRSGITARSYQEKGYKNVFVLDCGIMGL